MVIATTAVKAATTINPGEQCMITSNEIDVMAAATDDVNFCGIADGKSLSADVLPIPVQRLCLVDAGMTSAVYAFGQTLKWASAGVFVDGDANGIAWCHNDNASARTRATVYVNVMALAAVGSDAKLYETSAA
jgi:hypothetical protein